MNLNFKIFTFKGTPVSVNVLFFLLILFLKPIEVFAIFISVLVHEMAHALMAKIKGYDVYEIRVDMLSGSALIDPNTHDRDLIGIVAAGPISNFILFLIGLLTLFIPINNPNLIELFKYFTTINIILFIFNIIPIYPMDGGQIVRSIANLSKNRQKSRKIASWVSFIFSILLLSYSIYTLSLILSILSVYFVYLSFVELKKYI